MHSHGNFTWQSTSFRFVLLEFKSFLKYWAMATVLLSTGRTLLTRPVGYDPKTGRHIDAEGLHCHDINTVQLNLNFAVQASMQHLQKGRRRLSYPTLNLPQPRQC